MSHTNQAQFRERISSAYQLLRGVSEEGSQRPLREEGWSRKEILGHLVDSALNNHQRFVRAALDGSYTGPTYAQSDWVNIHGYRSMPWASLLEHWRLQNVLLGEVIRRVPESMLEAPCRIGDNAPVSLRFLIEDYVAHLDHHLKQLLTTT